jgi:hypothetical protein
MPDLITLPIEMSGSPEWTDQLGNGNGTRKWLVDTDDVYTFTGRPVEGSTKITAGLSWLAGTRADLLICDSIRHVQKGAGYTVGAVTYPSRTVEVTATYRERQGFSDYGLLQVQGDVQLITVPPGMPAQRICAAERLETVMYFLTSSNRAASLDALLNTINNASWRGRAAGKLQFESYSLNQFYDGSGLLLDKVTYHFNYNPNGWNYVPTAAGGWVLRDPVLYTASNWGGLGIQG